MLKRYLLLPLAILLLGCGQQSAETTTQAQPVAIVESADVAEPINDESATIDFDTSSDEMVATTDKVAEKTSNQQPATTPQMDTTMSSGGGMMDGLKTLVFGDAGNVNFDGIEQNEALSRAAVKAIKRAAEEEEIARILAIFPTWDAEVDADDDDVWWMDFYSTDGDWLGWAGVNMADNVVFEFEMAGFKSQEEINATLPVIEAAAMSDPEIQAIIGDAQAGDWYTEPGYDPYDEQYYFYFEKGIESYLAMFWIEDDGTVYIDSIVDPEALEEADQEQWNQDQAVEIAYEIPNLWERFDGIDDYRTFVSPQGDNVYAVSFAHSGGEIAYALVNIDTREILESR